MHDGMPSDASDREEEDGDTELAYGRGPGVDSSDHGRAANEVGVPPTQSLVVVAGHRDGCRVLFGALSLCQCWEGPSCST